MSEQPVLEQLTVQFVVGDSGGGWLPTSVQIKRWASAALNTVAANPGEVTVRIVGLEEGRRLNERYRRTSGATNVLAFPADLPADDIAINMLGDIVVCAPVANREAREQGKEYAAHWAHLVIHGVLHLLGYDHLHDEQAQAMEVREVAILTDLGFPDPCRQESALQDNSHCPG